MIFTRAIAGSELSNIPPFSLFVPRSGTVGEIGKVWRCWLWQRKNVRHFPGKQSLNHTNYLESLQSLGEGRLFNWCHDRTRDLWKTALGCGHLDQPGHLWVVVLDMPRVRVQIIYFGGYLDVMIKLDISHLYSSFYWLYLKSLMSLENRAGETNVGI